MKTVFRYGLRIQSGWQSLDCPPGPVLMVAEDDRLTVPAIRMWVEHARPDWLDEPLFVKAGEKPVEVERHLRHFEVFGTGRPIPDEAQWRGSVIIGAMVWHVFEHLPAATEQR